MPAKTPSFPRGFGPPTQKGIEPRFGSWFGFQVLFPRPPSPSPPHGYDSPSPATDARCFTTRTNTAATTAGWAVCRAAGRVPHTPQTGRRRRARRACLGRKSGLGVSRGENGGQFRGESALIGKLIYRSMGRERAASRRVMAEASGIMDCVTCKHPRGCDTKLQAIEPKALLRTV